MGALCVDDQHGPHREARLVCPVRDLCDRCAVQRGGGSDEIGNRRRKHLRPWKKVMTPVDGPGGSDAMRDTARVTLITNGLAQPSLLPPPRPSSVTCIALLLGPALKSPPAGLLDAVMHRGLRGAK